MAGLSQSYRRLTIASYVGIPSILHMHKLVVVVVVVVVVVAARKHTGEAVETADCSTQVSYNKLRWKDSRALLSKKAE